MLEDFIKVENLKLHFTKSEIDCIFQDGTMGFIRNIGDKAKAILFLEEKYGVSVSDMLVAGNAVNDVDMLNLPAGHRILVGEDEQSNAVLQRVRDPESVIRVASPVELGKYLSTL
jgi:hydroxymethylpyrimidine pyrophosphatase-like HAD family hydrolase